MYIKSSKLTKVVQSEGMNCSYLYKLINTHNVAEVSSEDNSQTEPNSSQETAPLECQLIVKEEEAAASGGRKASAPTSRPCRSWELLSQTTHSSCSAPATKHLLLLQLLSSLKKHPGAPSFSTQQLQGQSWRKHCSMRVGS